jgi:hypothetical protein
MHEPNRASEPRSGLGKWKHHPARPGDDGRSSADLEAVESSVGWPVRFPASLDSTRVVRFRILHPGVRPPCITAAFGLAVPASKRRIRLEDRPVHITARLQSALRDIAFPESPRRRRELASECEARECGRKNHLIPLPKIRLPTIRPWQFCYTPPSPERQQPFHVSAPVSRGLRGAARGAARGTGLPAGGVDGAAHLEPAAGPSPVAGRCTSCSRASSNRDHEGEPFRDSLPVSETCLSGA